LTGAQSRQTTRDYLIKRHIRELLNEGPNVKDQSPPHLFLTGAQFWASKGDYLIECYIWVSLDQGTDIEEKHHYSLSQPSVSFIFNKYLIPPNHV
jgi:hypothetical protein